MVMHGSAGVAALGAGLAVSSETLLAREELANVGRVCMLCTQNVYVTVGIGLAIVLFIYNSLLQLSLNHSI